MNKREIYNNNYYHVFSRSIAKFQIFNRPEDYNRIITALKLYQFKDFCYGFSHFLTLSKSAQLAHIKSLDSSPRIVDIIAYCIMPTHIHLILKQNLDNGVSLFMSKVLDSYSRYFNLQHGRKGPLWESRFSDILILNDNQMLHLTRYIHLNPTSAGLVKNPLEWDFSSYHEYVNSEFDNGFCSFRDIITLAPKEYQKFTEDQISFQKQLAIIKSLLIDNYSG